MIVATRYIIVQDEKTQNSYRIINRDLPRCPKCQEIMVGYDTRKRQVKNSAGTTQIFYLRRMRCPCCKIIHLEVPDFIVAHKHYDKEVISLVLSGDAFFCPADNSTIRRWKRQNHPPVLPFTSETNMIKYKQTKVKDGEEE